MMELNEESYDLFINQEKNNNMKTKQGIHELSDITGCPGKKMDPYVHFPKFLTII